MDPQEPPAVPKDQWVCPNDRQLALRAKLRTGWSVKSTRMLSYGKNYHLTQEEQDTIVSVIKKAEALELAEQRRIGYLVERMENMKKNSKGNGLNQCALCGEHFRLLASCGLLCRDCNKALCEKCVVNLTSTSKESIWLCKLCAEYREVWKKSGAWFFKSLPKFILPVRKRSEGVVPRPKIVYRRYNSWTNGAELDCQDNLEESSDEDREDNIGGASLGTDKRAEQRGKIQDHDVYNSVGAQDEMIRVVQTACNRRKDSSQSSIDSLDFSTTSEDSNYGRPWQRQNSFYSLQEERERIPREVVLLSTRNRSCFSSGPFIVTLGSLEFSTEYNAISHTLCCAIFRAKGLVVRDSRFSVPLVYVEASTTPANGADGCSKLRTKAVRSSNPEFDETLTLRGVAEDQLPLKILKLAVRGLMSKDLNGYSDPFVKVQLKPDPLCRKFKTSTKWKTLNPEFNEEFVFEIKLAELPRKTLEITVWDKDYMKKDYLGGIQLGIDSKKELLRHWFETLRNPDRRHDRWHLLSQELFADSQIRME